MRKQLSCNGLSRDIEAEFAALAEGGLDRDRSAVALDDALCQVEPVAGSASARLFELQSEIEDLIVRKTKGASGAFIKELMRRSAQFLLETGSDNLSERHIESALDEMLFSGGELNSKLLGMAPTG